MTNPADVSSIDAIINAAYEVISGRAGKKRDWDRDRSLFLPGARLIPTATVPGRNDVELAPLVLDMEAYIQRVEPLFAEAKDWHGLRRFRLRGLANVNSEGLMVAAGQNLKGWLAATGWGRRHAPCGSLMTRPTPPPLRTATCG